MHYHCTSPLRTIRGHILTLRPGIAEAERGHDPHSSRKVIEVVEVRPDTPFTVTALHYCEDMHEEEQEEGDPSEDDIMQAVVEGRED